jgi:hypothetical protein
MVKEVVLDRSSVGLHQAAPGSCLLLATGAAVHRAATERMIERALRRIAG